MEHEGDGDTNCSWCTWNVRKWLGENTGGIENQRKNLDFLDSIIVEIG